MTRPTAKAYAQAQDQGAAARRACRPETSNPWESASTEHDRILRDAWGRRVPPGEQPEAEVIELPLRIESVANRREHWATKARRTKAHRLAALAVPVHPLPCIVTLIRVAPRTLDTDNLASGFKALRDGIADRLGVDDADPRVEWRYGQAKGKAKEYAARVRIEPKGE